ncbi:alpha/beta hydrolase [Campylobacter sp. faydin G-105]|uniref:alpha/beta fold hydrolase n=1 Tax=Campylobacter anatolicus TaxID=2829105 RepID=UPI001B98F4C2|nr:alpha/beta hydrolase [Campylobacter anatolicus]MBR8462838.1 alpha/beta hydrolase [Campylobacter anatolicus]
MASKLINYNGFEYNISYEMLNANSDIAVLFLHGWGANKELMKKAFSSHLSQFAHIYVDMPGFGASSIDKSLYTNDYANIMQIFINSLKNPPSIIIGHSFGGKVATLLNPKNLVLLSTAGIVPKKRLSVRMKIAIFKALKALGFGKFYKLFATKDVAGMSQTMYETLKNVVDEDFSDKFYNFFGNALIFWGDGDRATPLKSGENIHKMIKNSKFYPLKGDHFFFLLHAKFISDMIEQSIFQSQDLSDDSSVNGVCVLKDSVSLDYTKDVR